MAVRDRIEGSGIDPDALADGILSLRLDPSLAASLSRAGASGVRQHYSVQKMAERVEEIYGELTRDA